MTRHVLVGFGALVLLAGVTATGCSSSSDNCDAKSPCPNDTPPTQATINQCKTSAKNCDSDPKCSKCKSQASALGDCAKNSITCGADGKTDGVATGTKLVANCKSQSDAYTACMM